MKKIIFLSIFFASIFQCQAQTKLISHKSHSGSKANFKTALDNKLFDLPFSDFGEAPNPIIKMAKLDSLIYINDTAAVMVTSISCTNTWIENADTTIWKEGTDTVYHHPLFNLKYDLDSIKKNLRKQYYFRNDAKDIKFIGYDNGESMTKDEAKEIKKAEIESIKEQKRKLKEEYKSKKKALNQSIKNIKEGNKNQNQNLLVYSDHFQPPTPPNGATIPVVLFILSTAGILGFIHSKLNLNGS